MAQLAYLAVLGFIVCGTVWLEYFLRTRVLSRPRRLLLAVVPVLVVFIVWDLYAISSGHWSFSQKFTTGWAAGVLPLEEVLFFVVVPIASILTLEAVRSARGWKVGDEGETALRTDTHRGDTHRGDTHRRSDPS